MKMVSTHEMLVHLAMSNLNPAQASFVKRLSEVDQRGEITRISEEDIEHLNALYISFKVYEEGL